MRTLAEWHDALTALAVRAGADETQARELFADSVQQIEAEREECRDEYRPKPPADNTPGGEWR